jgi:hypothetical protein
MKRLGAFQVHLPQGAEDVPLWRLVLPEPDQEAKSVESVLWQQNFAVIPKGWNCAIFALGCGDIATFCNRMRHTIASCDMAAP